MSGLFWLSEEQFNKIRPLLPNKPRGVPRVDDRKVLSGIIFCLQRGYRWSDVPLCYGPAKTLYNRYKRWSAAGIFEGIFATLAHEHADFAILMLDATMSKPITSPLTVSKKHRRRTGYRAHQRWAEF